MIKRYSNEAFLNLWSDQSKFDAFLEVEKACVKAYHQLKIINDQTYEKLLEASFDIDDIYMFEQETKHDVIAFIKAVSKHLGDEQAYFHYGLTSTDIVDTAQSLILKKANDLIFIRLNEMMDVLLEKAHAYKQLITIGRTHGIHAEPTSFGLKFLLWYNDFKRLIEDFKYTRKKVEVVKLSGAVGNFNANTPKLQSLVAQSFQMDEVLLSTQVIQRDRHASYIAMLALIGAQIDKMAVEIRHLSRTEVGEVQEYFEQGQKGSSAMPHKKNPITSENVGGLSRLLKGYVTTAYENISLWHERDISHSSAERVILADATTLVDYMLKRFTQTIKTLVIFEDKVKENIDLTYGSIYSQSLLNKLIEKGLNRMEAYDIVQASAHHAVNNRIHLKHLCLKRKPLNTSLNQEDINYIFDNKRYLTYIDEIYEKVCIK